MSDAKPHFPERGPVSYFALHTDSVDPEDDQSTHEAAYDGYARQPLVVGEAATFPSPDRSIVVTHWSLSAHGAQTIAIVGCAAKRVHPGDVVSVALSISDQT